MKYTCNIVLSDVYNKIGIYIISFIIQSSTCIVAVCYMWNCNHEMIAACYFFLSFISFPLLIEVIFCTVEVIKKYR